MTVVATPKQRHHNALNYLTVLVKKRGRDVSFPRSLALCFQATATLSGMECPLPVQQMSPYGGEYLFGSGFFRWLSVVLRTYVLMMRITWQVRMMRGIVPADEKAVVRIEPVIGILLQGIAVILLADPERAAIGENHLELEGVIINSSDSDLYHEFGQDRPDTGDSSLQ